MRCPGCGSENLELLESRLNFYVPEFLIDLMCLHCGADVLAVCPVALLDSKSGRIVYVGEEKKKV